MVREFLSERGLNYDGDGYNQSTKSNEKLPESSTLLEIYKEQFHYIQQIEAADLRLFIIVVAVIIALWIFAALPFIGLNQHHIFGIIIILTLLTAAANHMTIKNAAIRWSRFLTLGQIEKALGLRNNGIIMVSAQFVLPVSLRDFVVRFLFSPFGPRVLVYTLIVAMAITELQWNIMQIHSIPFFFLMLSVPFILSFTSIYANYVDIIHQFKAMNEEAELGVRCGVKSPGDHYCDVADALMQMHPPLQIEALKHYREALRIEPDNVRARVGFDRLMNWKFKNNN